MNISVMFVNLVMVVVILVMIVTIVAIMILSNLVSNWFICIYTYYVCVYIAHCLKPIAYCLVHIAHCLLPIAYPLIAYWVPTDCLAVWKYCNQAMNDAGHTVEAEANAIFDFRFNQNFIGKPEGEPSLRGGVMYKDHTNSKRYIGNVGRSNGL